MIRELIISSGPPVEICGSLHNATNSEEPEDVWVTYLFCREKNDVICEHIRHGRRIREK